MFLEKQRRSRKAIARAVADYVNLRAGSGPYDDVIRTTDRNGNKVAVMIHLDIVPSDED